MTSAALPLDAMNGVAGPGAAAELAAEALRVVNRLTIGAPSPGVAGWEEVGDLYRVLGELRVHTERLPQALGQLARHLERPRDGIYYRSDSGTCEHAETLVTTAVMALEDAERDVRQVGINLSAAQSAVAHLYT